MMASLGESDPPPKNPAPRPERKVVYLWIPKRFVVGLGVDVLAFVADVNEKISARGYVLWSGQILTTPLPELPPEGILQAESVQGHWTNPIRFGTRSEVYVEPGIFVAPPLREWDDEQRAYFGIDHPFQMGEAGETYTSYHIGTVVQEPYLFPHELVAAIVHGKKDDYPFYCTCHYADVVYTTQHRLVCMSCGGTHVVLREPLQLDPIRLLSAQEWFDHFDEDGASRDDEIEMSIVDFRNVENAKLIWQTDIWEEAKHLFIFWARSTPEEIEEATRGTEADPSIFLEAGWKPIELPPSPAQQIAKDAVDVDLVENAEHAVREGAEYFLSARTRPEDLVTAIPLLFRAVELLLKARLFELDAKALGDQPNNPTVLKRLVAANVSIDQAELETIIRLRRLRNDLQHGTAKFNYRRGLAVSRATLVFIDRFASAELNLWIGDVVLRDKWEAVLRIPEIAATAERVVEERLVGVRADPSASIAICARCGKGALVRPHPHTGSSCLYCGRAPPPEDV